MTKIPWRNVDRLGNAGIEGGAASRGLENALFRLHLHQPSGGCVTSVKYRRSDYEKRKREREREREIGIHLADARATSEITVDLVYSAQRVLPNLYSAPLAPLSTN